MDPILPDTEVKKRRGRRPKSEKQLVVVSNEEMQQAQAALETKSKRGRKPKYVYNAFEVANQSSINNNQSDDENIIVKLNIPIEDEKDVADDNGNSCIQDNTPYAYNRDSYNNISGANVIEHTQSMGLENIKEESCTELKVLELLKDFEEKNKNNEWPSNTSISCYWCCHKFDNPPFGIPVNYKNNKFEVFGCFCSLECAAMHNFKENDNIDEMWERYNLINLMCRELNMGDYVKPAPDRLSLKMFGGFMDIDKFRSYFKTNKIININFPPMTSISQQLEEINEYELNSDLKYVPIDNDRINKYKEKILFKRSKPLINPKTSLESSMNLKYH
jgi:hypothetical protein